eukprot:4593991-Pyramimonas_sp.AAC.2
MMNMLEWVRRFVVRVREPQKYSLTADRLQRVLTTSITRQVRNTGAMKGFKGSMTSFFEGSNSPGKSQNGTSSAEGSFRKTPLSQPLDSAVPVPVVPAGSPAPPQKPPAQKPPVVNQPGCKCTIQ